MGIEWMKHLCPCVWLFIERLLHTLCALHTCEGWSEQPGMVNTCEFSRGASKYKVIYGVK